MTGTSRAVRVAVGLGSSLGDRRATLDLAVRKLAATPGVRLVRGSRWYRSPPLRGGRARNWFLNAVVLLEVTLRLDELLERCRALEAHFGRRRALHWGDRTLDVDVLLAEGVVKDGPELVLPHPAIAERSFVLRPLLDVWPDAVDPRTRVRFADVGPGRPPQPWPVGAIACGPAARGVPGSRPRRIRP